MKLFQFFAYLIVSNYIFFEVSKKIFTKLKFYDLPDQQRKKQKGPVLKSGGFTIFWSCTLNILAATYMFDFKIDQKFFYIVILPSFLVLVIGFIDDLIKLSPFNRLTSVSIVAIFSWLQKDRLNLFSFEIINFIIYVGIFIFVVNSFNLFDNTDSALISVIFSINLFFLYYFWNFQNKNLLILTTIFLVSIIFFFKFNMSPARLYLGDSGAYFFGAFFLMFALETFNDPHNGINSSHIFSLILLFIIPAVDTLYVIYSRLNRGIHIFTAGRDHILHKLQEKSYSTNKILFFANTFIFLSLISLNNFNIIRFIE
jgi:UDP-GlcNAc:undecaprenyl-phosphate GlcNAc-1-phosphate transferase